MVKVISQKCKIAIGNLYLTENQLSRKAVWCTVDNHKYMCHICVKGFLDSNSNREVTNKISDFHEIASNFAYSQKW